MLVYCARPDVKVKFDWLAMLGTAFTLCIVGTAALLPLAISEWNPAREYARNRIESQKADAMYSALTADPALKAKLNSLNVEARFFHEADGDYTLQSGDDCILYAALQGPYADAETFAADCMAVMQRAADDGLGFTCYHFNADEDTDDGISYYLDCVASYPAGLTAARWPSACRPATTMTITASPVKQTGMITSAASCRMRFPTSTPTGTTVPIPTRNT